MNHWHDFIIRYPEATPQALHIARQAWEKRQELDAELVANHCPSHRNIGELMAKEIREKD